MIYAKTFVDVFGLRKTNFGLIAHCHVGYLLKTFSESVCYLIILMMNFRNRCPFLADDVQYDSVNRTFYGLFMANK